MRSLAITAMVVSTVLFTLLTYLGGAFCYASFNIVGWGFEGRFCVALMWFMTLPAYCFLGLFIANEIKDFVVGHR